MNKDQFAYLNETIVELQEQLTAANKRVTQLEGKSGYCVQCEQYARKIDRLENVLAAEKVAKCWQDKK